jgi:hypothetical protein
MHSIHGTGNALTRRSACLQSVLTPVRIISPDHTLREAIAGPVSKLLPVCSTSVLQRATNSQNVRGSTSCIHSEPPSSRAAPKYHPCSKYAQSPHANITSHLHYLAPEPLRHVIASLRYMGALGTRVSGTKSSWAWKLFLQYPDPRSILCVSHPTALIPASSASSTTSRPGKSQGYSSLQHWLTQFLAYRLRRQIDLQ